MSAITGLGIFSGLVAGVIVQISANIFMQYRQQKNAAQVLLCEVELNLAALKELQERTKTARERVAAEQANEMHMEITMSDFDFSAMAPLVNSGYFHKILGHDGVQKYFSVVRTLNNAEASRLTMELAESVKKGKHLDFFDDFKARLAKAEYNLNETKKSLKQ